MIASPGIGSGLDINALVNQLVAAEGEPKFNRLAFQEAGTQAKLSAFGLLKSSLADFSASVDALKSLGAFDGRQAKSGDITLFSASAANSAVLGTYNLEITTIASAQKLQSAGFAATTDVVGSGTITIKSGAKTAEVAVNSGTDTLADVRNAINQSSAASGVTATIITVDDGIGGNESRLLLSASDTGTANEITVTVDDDDLNDIDNSGLSRLVYDPGGSGTTNLSVASAAADALIKIDNQNVTRPSNTITDAIDGVTLNLVSASPGNATSLTVTQDTSASLAAIEDFVAKFNALHANIAELTKFDAETGQRGILLGNAAARSLTTQLRRELNSSVPGIDASLNTLSELGIRTLLDGTLEIDNAVLDDALASRPNDVAALFKTTNGIAVSIDSTLDAILQTGGSISASLDGLNATLEDIADQRESLERRLVTLEQRLFSQFNAMDALVGQLQSTSNFLTRQLLSIESIVARSPTNR